MKANSQVYDNLLSKSVFHSRWISISVSIIHSQTHLLEC